MYLSLLELSASTTGPIIEQSGVARSFIYTILNSLIEKGVVSHTTKEKQKIYQAAEPEKILDFLAKKKAELEEKSESFRKKLDIFKAKKGSTPQVSVQVYEGYKGIITAFEHYKQKLGKGDEYLVFGHPMQELSYTLYWKRHHIERQKEKIHTRMLFDQGTSAETMKNRNSFSMSDTRFIPTNIKTKAWFYIYADTVTIFVQEDKEIAVEIINKKIADTLRVIFEDYWNKTEKYK